MKLVTLMILVAYISSGDLSYAELCAVTPVHTIGGTARVNEVAILDRATNKTKTVYSGYVEMNSAQASSDGRLTAFVSHNDTRDTLKVVDARGREVISVQSAVTFSISPRSDAIAYIALDVPSSQAMQPGQTGTAWVYDLEKHSNQKVATEASALHWAQFDGRLYVKSGRTGRVEFYDPLAQSLQSCKHKGVQFSPDGQYYYEDVIMGPSRIYLSTDDTDITEKCLEQRHAEHVVAERWVGAARLLLREQDGSGADQEIVLSLNDCAVHFVPAKWILGYLEQTEELIVDDVKLLPLDKLPLRTKEQEGAFKFVDESQRSRHPFSCSLCETQMISGHSSRGHPI